MKPLSHLLGLSTLLLSLLNPSVWAQENGSPATVAPPLTLENPGASYPAGTRVSDWLGYSMYEFTLGENAVKIVHPKNPIEGKRWVWKAEFFSAFPSFDQEMLKRGWYVAFISVGNTFGCPSAMQRFDVFYEELTGRHGFNRRPILEGLSRGGLYVYNWAANHPDNVGLVYADNAVCDFKSWPGGKGKGKGSAKDWAALLKCYGFASEHEAMAWTKNPVDNLASLVKAGVPLAHSFGDADDTVPWEENTGLLTERVEQMGGRVTLFRKPGMNHHPHGPLDPESFAEWAVKNALK